MGVPGIEAEHITLVLENASPEALPDKHIRQLNKIGMNRAPLASAESPFMAHCVYQGRLAKSSASRSKSRRPPNDQF